MNVTNKEGWKQFVYLLLYPALLGSMLYDIFDFSQPLNVRYFSKLVVVLLYCVDYLHLFVDLQAPTSPQTSVVEAIGDGSAALLFRGAFSALAVDRPLMAILLMALIGAVFILYNLKVLPRAASLVGMIVGLILAAIAISGYPQYGMKIFLVASVVTLLLALVHVFIICRPPQNNTQAEPTPK